MIVCRDRYVLFFALREAVTGIYYSHAASSVPGTSTLSCYYIVYSLFCTQSSKENLREVGLVTDHICRRSVACGTARALASLRIGRTDLA